MKPPPFDYERPVDINGALASLASHGGRAKVLAGGQSLLAMLNLRLLSPERLIDVSRLDELKYIRMAGNELRIGALTTHNTVLKSADVTTHCPIMAEAYRHVSHHSVRNRGTIGGSLCHNDPAAEMPLVMAPNYLEAKLAAEKMAAERLLLELAPAAPTSVVYEAVWPRVLAKHIVRLPDVNKMAALGALSEAV